MPVPPIRRVYRDCEEVRDTRNLWITATRFMKDDALLKEAVPAADESEWIGQMMFI